jgi:hypothetical protein
MILGCAVPRLLAFAILLASLWPPPANAGVRLDNRLVFTRPDGAAVAFAHTMRVWCGRWDREVPTRTLHIRVGTEEGPFWTLRTVVADVRRRPVVRLPHSFVWNRPSGAQLFALDGDNEVSSAEEEASGRISFHRVRCGRRLAVRFRVRAVLGSELFGREPVSVSGRFSLTT